ncbi:hypothetical protein ACOSP7_001275 [Xanthoceras sorbifolium]
MLVSKSVDAVPGASVFAGEVVADPVFAVVAVFSELAASVRAAVLGVSAAAGAGAAALGVAVSTSSVVLVSETIAAVPVDTAVPTVVVLGKVAASVGAAVPAAAVLGVPAIIGAGVAALGGSAGVTSVVPPCVASVSGGSGPVSAGFVGPCVVGPVDAGTGLAPSGAVAPHGAVQVDALLVSANAVSASLVPADFFTAVGFSSFAPPSGSHVTVACFYRTLQTCSNILFLEFELAQETEMYPRVRVRVQEQQDGQVSPPNDRGPFLFLRLLESLSLQDCSLPKENHCNSSPANAKVTMTCVPDVKLESDSASTEKNNTDIHKDTKLNARVSSIPRPRAVLSSPENDGMIGNRNKLQKYTTFSSPKKLNSTEQKMRAQTAAIPNPVKTRSPLSARKGSRDAMSDNKRALTQTKLSKSGIQRRKASLQEGKPSSIGA